MKKLLTIVLLFAATFVFAQEAKKSVIKPEKQSVDTLCVFTLPDYFKFIQDLDRSIDSKAVTQELIKTLQKHIIIVPTQTVPQPADKAKPVKP